MNFWKKISKVENELPEEDGYNGYGYGDNDVETDDGIVGVPDYGDGTTTRTESAQAAPNVVSGDKVSLKLMQPRSHTEAPDVADRLISGCIVVLDIGELQRDSKESVFRLLDFLAGVIHVLNGQMIRTNKTTIVLAPNGVDISGFEVES